MIQADSKLTLAADGSVGILETSVMVDEDADNDQIVAAIYTAQQVLNRTIASALTMGDVEHVPDVVPDNLAD